VESSRFTAVEIAAAQLRVELDESLGRTTPEPIREAAAHYDWSIHPPEQDLEPGDLELEPGDLEPGDREPGDQELEPEPEPELEPWWRPEPDRGWEPEPDRGWEPGDR
jgi:hypothetical protein